MREFPNPIGQEILVIGEGGGEGRTGGKRTIVKVEAKFRAPLNVSHVAVTSATLDALIRRRRRPVFILMPHIRR